MIFVSCRNNTMEYLSSFMSLLFGLWIIASNKRVQACYSPYDADCWYCYCADSAEECNDTTGHCESGCKELIPDFPNNGAGCRNGLVVGPTALEDFKTGAQQISGVPMVMFDWSFDNDPNRCFQHDSTNGADDAWVGIKLPLEYIITGVYILTIPDNDDLIDVKVLVGNDFGLEGDLCGTADKIHPDISISCPPETKGRFVNIVNSKTAQSYDEFILCEVVIQGYEPADCTLCAENTPCSSLSGCSECPSGKRLSNCKRDCLPHTYGVNCDGQCHCKSQACDSISGECDDSGCEYFWSPSPLCNQHIETPDMTGIVPDVISVSSKYADISFKQLDLDNKLAAHYYYVVQYIATGGSGLEEMTIYHDKETVSASVKLEDLREDTTYTWRVLPFRADIENDVIESGIPSAEASFTTDKKKEEGSWMQRNRVGVADTLNDTASQPPPPEDEDVSFLVVGGAVVVGSMVCMGCAVGLAIVLMRYRDKRRREKRRIRKVASQDAPEGK